MNNRSAKRVPSIPSPAYIESLYRTMAAALGPTGWWPAETTFEIMVGAVLTQNTAWGNVNRSLAALNAEGVLEPHKLAIMGPAHLQELIRPSGFYVNKSKTVQSLSRWYAERCGASPEGAADIPDAELRTELLGLFGIGGETADDLMLYVFSRRTFVADTYARRLFAFLGFDVPDKADRDAVLRRRYDLLNGHDVHFFYCDAGNPLSIEQIDDPYRRGIIAVHDAEIAAELDWLRSMLGVEDESVTQ